MSEVRLNILDRIGTINGTVHGSVADAVVAALSAEPETIADLETALSASSSLLMIKSLSLCFTAARTNRPGMRA